MSALEKKLAKDVKKLRKVLEMLRYCYDDEGRCEDCDFRPYHDCVIPRRGLIVKVLAATKPKRAKGV